MFYVYNDGYNNPQMSKGWIGKNAKKAVGSKVSKRPI